MASGSLIATLSGSQWTVRDPAGNTVAWISPASRDLWTVSAWGPFSRGTYGFPSARAAFEAVCEECGNRYQDPTHMIHTRTLCPSFETIVQPQQRTPRKLTT